MALSGNIAAQEADNCPFAQEEKPPARYEERPMIEVLKGIVLIPSPKYVHYTDLRGIEGLQVHDVWVPGGLEGLRCLLEPLFVGRPLTQELLTLIKEQIVLYYRDHNHPVVAIYVPPQEITEGVLQLVVLEGCVGQVGVSGNCWFPNRFYENSLRIGPGDAITADALLTDVSWLNRNPFRNVDVVFTPGCEPGLTNIDLVVCDRFPFQIYVGGDNTGIDASNPARLYTGVTWGNAFGLDHVLSYQYTTSPDFKEFQSHTGHWTIPLPLHNYILLFGGWSKIDPKIQDFEGEGRAYQASLRYVIPFGCNYNGHLQEWSFGFDYKHYNNNLLFTSDEAFPIVTKSVDLSQFMLSYAYGCEDCCHRFSFNLSLYGSPGRLFPDQSQKRYDNLSPNAKVKYIYGLMTLGETLYLPFHFSLAALVRLQLASQNLLPSERFGIGGYDTVRGYLEREFLADNVLITNVELRTPSFSALNFFGRCGRCDEMLFFIFFDYGLGNINDRSGFKEEFPAGPHIGVTEYFMSFGPGWRYTINRYLSARVDWGVKLHRSAFGDSARSRWHAGMVFSY